MGKEEKAAEMSVKVGALNTKMTVRILRQVERRTDERHDKLVKLTVKNFGRWVLIFKKSSGKSLPTSHKGSRLVCICSIPRPWNMEGHFSPHIHR